MTARPQRGARDAPRARPSAHTSVCACTSAEFLRLELRTDVCRGRSKSKNLAPCAGIVSLTMSKAKTRPLLVSDSR